MPFPESYLKDKKDPMPEKNLLEQLAPILYKKWEPDPDDVNKIIHYWAEDSSETIIEVPKQLRDSIILMQNWLAEKYIEIEGYKKKMHKLANFFRF